LSEFFIAPDHAASRPFRRFCGTRMTLSMAPSEVPSITPMERPSRRFAAASSSSSASSDTASSYCAADNGTRRGGDSRISLEFFFANHGRAGRGAKVKRSAGTVRRARTLLPERSPSEAREVRRAPNDFRT
jgi:hypothetical protein